MDEQNEQEILRLNNKIKNLLTLNEKGIVATQQLEKEIKCCRDELRLTKLESIKTSQFNLQYKFDLEKAITERENTNEIFQKQKRNLMDVMQKLRIQTERNAMLERMLQDQGNHAQSSKQVEQNDQQILEIKTLDSKVQKLENELDEAYDIIDGLEFELEEIDFLESEIERLQKELREQSPNKTKDIEVQLRQKNISDDMKERRATLHKKLKNLHARQSSNFGKSNPSEKPN